MLAGGGMYETGAGGSASKHVQQVEEETICAGTPWVSFWRSCFPGRYGE